MSPKKNPIKMQMSIIAGLIAAGLVFILIAFSLESLKDFGSTQLFFIRNGAFFCIAGLIALLFPGIINYISQTFNDSEYQSERTEYLTVRSLFSKHDFILIFLFLIAANAFTIYFIGKENTIYDWDAGHFWSRYMEISLRFYDNPLKAILLTLETMQYGEYSYFSTILLTPFALVFGIERLPFILSIVNIFGFLSALSFLFLFKRFLGIMHDYKSSYIVSLIPLLTFFTFPFIWTPILFGYVALGGFFIMCLILLLYFEFPLSAQRYKTLMAIGILLAILVLFRRWYAHWAVAFMITLTINELIFLYIDHKLDRDRLIVIAKKISFILFTAGIFYALIAGPRLLEVVSKDYSYIAAAFGTHSLQSHIASFFDIFGFFYIILTVSGLFISLYFKKSRKFASFLLIQGVITFLLFTRMSLLAFHHYYLFQPTILLFISLFIAVIFLKLKSKTQKIIACTFYFLISIAIFVAVFFPGASSYAQQAKGLFPRLAYYPMVREDIDEIKRMFNVLGSIMADPDDRVYVLAGSEILNFEHFHKARLSLKDIPPIDKQTFKTHDLDLRDGFPSDLFKAKYTIVTDPVQCGLGCKKQRVISIPAESILKGENMGRSYDRLPYEFTLDRGVKAYIYKRSVPSAQADIKSLSHALRQYYPDNPFVYEPYIE